MTAAEISRIKIANLRDGRSWLSVIQPKIQEQMKIMQANADNNAVWQKAQTEHYDLIQQKKRIQNEMGRFVKIEKGAA